MSKTEVRSGKRKAVPDHSSVGLLASEKFDELFVNAPPDGSDSLDGDSTDSEESQYSELEEEEDSDSDDDVDSVEEASSSDDGSDDSDSDKKLENNDIGRKGKNSVGKLKKTKSADSGIDAGSSLSKARNTDTKEDEYKDDSSDEEDIRNTVGNIPLEWYRDYKHIGYDVEGRRLIKPEKRDELDAFLNKMDNPDYWRTVTDKMTGQDVVLSKQDIDTIQQLRKGKYPVDASFNPYEDYVDFFTRETMIHPVTNRPEDKRSFIPSKWEKLKVGQMVHAIKMGWMKPRKPKSEEDEEEQKFYALWEGEDQSELSRSVRPHMPAPKLPLPGHEESYNPPPEYLMTEEEQLAWNEAEPEDRKLNFIPQKYDCLRHVPAYKRFINERFERCLDLYLCPRQQKMKMNVNPEDLLPKLPKPRDLQPFPTTEAIVYKGHKGLVRTVSPDPTGQWLVSGSDDCTLKFWEVSTGRCMKSLTLDKPVKCVSWNPNPSLSLLLVVVSDSVLVINTQLGDKLNLSNTDDLIDSYDTTTAGQSKVPVEWKVTRGKLYDEGHRLMLSHPKELSQVTWHAKGDYFAVVMPQGESMSVLIHQLSKRRSQNPFSKSKGMVQKVLFHPLRPFLFVATQRYVRVYNLATQELSKKLQGNCKWISSIAIHPGGDNVIIGSYDSRLSWFDLDLSTKPYQTLRHHKKALRQVCYHRRYPLFASASDDGTVIVCHGMVYNDLLQNALIVPVKVLRGHSVVKDLCVLDCQFHPTQPWIFTAGADNFIRLYT